jgi:hypothetical protein
MTNTEIEDFRTEAEREALLNMGFRQTHGFLYEHASFGSLGLTRVRATVYAGGRWSLQREVRDHEGSAVSDDVIELPHHISLGVFRSLVASLLP